MSDMWAYSVAEDGNVHYGGKLLGFQSGKAVLQVWDAFLFVGCGVTQLTDQVVYADREKVITFLTRDACIESACNRIARYCPSFR